MSDRMLDDAEKNIARYLSKKPKNTGATGAGGGSPPQTTPGRKGYPLDDLDPNPRVNQAMNRYNRMILRNAPPAALKQQMQKVQRRRRKAGE